VITHLDRFYKLAEKFNYNLSLLCLYLHHVNPKYTAHKYYAKMSEISYQSTSKVYDVLQEATQRTEEDIKNFIAKYRYLRI